MTRKDYITIAVGLRTAYTTALNVPRRNLMEGVLLSANVIAGTLKNDNPKFDSEHFLAVVRGEKELKSRPPKIESPDFVDAQVTLLDKLSPKKLRLSAKMRWILDSVTGLDSGVTGPRGEKPQHISITSDGFIQSSNMFIGDAGDLKRNLEGVLKTIEATEDEKKAFWTIYRLHVTDWRMS